MNKYENIFNSKSAPIIKSGSTNYKENVGFENTSLPDIIELKNISMQYPGAPQPTIKDLNLLVEDKPQQGQFVVILGVSGCGKSTVLRFMCGLQKPTSGEVLIHGKPRDENTRIGMVFQQYSSFPWLSVLDNVALGLQYKGVDKKTRHEKAMEMIKLVGLDGQEHKYAKYPSLSGGQLQRVAIARSLVADPQILLMDEPFGALDLNTRLQMQDLLCEIWTKLQSTIIFVTHDLPEAVYLGDDIYIMRACPGKIVEKVTTGLPLIRNRDIKRTPKFIELVNMIEEKMISIQHFMDEEKTSTGDKNDN